MRRIRWPEWTGTGGRIHRNTQNTQPAYRLSGIGRPVDPRYPTNRAIAILFVVGLVVGGAWSLVTGVPFLQSVLDGLNAGLVVFISWALTRELAPDDQAAAFVAVGLSAVTWVVLSSQSILVPLALLLAARVVARTTGKAAERFDTVVLVVTFAALGWIESWTLSAVGAAALALDSVLPVSPGQEARPYHMGAAVLVLIGTAYLATQGLAAAVPPPAPVLLSVIAGATLVVALLQPMPESTGDVDGLRLRRSRVRSALLLGLLGAVAVTLDSSVPVTRLGVPWACLAAVVVGRGVGLVTSGD